MAGFYLYSSNQLEYLTDSLTNLISQNPLPPLIEEIIVTPGSGMERYISLALARSLGVCAHTIFPYANKFIHSIFTQVFPHLPEHTLFNPDILTWKIMSLLPSCLNEKEFNPLHHYLQNEHDVVKLFQLSRKIADLFDQYMVFRSEMIENWKSGKIGKKTGEQWQALLWNRIVDSTSDDHRILLRQKLADELLENHAIRQQLPSRISLFGFSFLPRFHLDIMQLLSQYTDIHAYVLNPCRQFWDDIVSEKQRMKKNQSWISTNLDNPPHHYETGNSLLASLGIQAKEFFQQLHHLGLDELEQSRFFPPDNDSLITQIQSDILNLTSPEPAKAINQGDHSIQLHLCHNRLREVEVLHDNLLKCFEQDRELSADDIVVMSPDIEEYIPFIHAVFSKKDSGIPAIPYTIADSNLRNHERLIDDFLTLLDLKTNRFAVSLVLALLDSPNIKRAFHLTEKDLAVIYPWIRQTNIRWGIDKSDRIASDSYAFEENTWKAGLDRMYLGFAMAPDNKQLFQGIYPLGTIDETDSSSLAKLSRFLNYLFAISKNIQENKSLSQWAQYLHSLLDTFFPDQDTPGYTREFLRTQFNNLSVQEQYSGFTDPIPFQVIRNYLDAALAKRTYGRQFLTGGVTFCTMLPMRSIPFKIICLLGMNDNCFPRSEPSLSFDLIATDHLIGDRSVRKEDRYCFLEALISARQKLLISYLAFNAKDNSSIPPSTVISELTDYLTKYYCLPSETLGSLVENLTWRHSLLPYARKYFLPTDEPADKYFSYSGENADAAKAVGKMSLEQPFIKAPIPLSDHAQGHVLTVEQLSVFWTHPIKFFLTHRLGLDLPSEGIFWDDREPFHLDYLDRYLLLQEMLEEKMTRSAPRFTYDNYYKAARAEGILPPGNTGVCAFTQIAQTIDQYQAVLNQAESNMQSQRVVTISLQLGDFVISGRVPRVSDTGLVHYRAATIKAKDRLRLWLHHLLLIVSENCSESCMSKLFGKDGEVKYRAYQYNHVEEAAEVLLDLLQIYYSGLIQPLPFFPSTSFAYASSRFQGKEREEALRSALNEWTGNTRILGEGSDGYYAMYPGTINPLNPAFEDLAMRIFNPLLNHEERLSL